MGGEGGLPGSGPPHPAQFACSLCAHFLYPLVCCILGRDFLPRCVLHPQGIFSPKVCSVSVSGVALRKASTRFRVPCIPSLPSRPPGPRLLQPAAYPHTPSVLLSSGMRFNFPGYGPECWLSRSVVYFPSCRRDARLLIRRLGAVGYRCHCLMYPSPRWFLPALSSHRRR